MSMCYEVTGKAPIDTRWIDINKGGTQNPNYRSRLVAKEIKRGTASAPDVFAATPPIEALRFIMSCAASQKGSKRKKIIMSNDVRRAYFYAPSVRRVFIKIPEEDYEEGDEDMCAELDFPMYGTRDAAHNWEIEYTNFLTGIGFISGTASPCHFHHPERGIDLVVHGDDFTSLGYDNDLNWLKAQFGKSMRLKPSCLGLISQRRFVF